MIKKEYIQPIIDCVVIDCSQGLLAGSIESVLTEGLNEDVLVIDPGVAPLKDNVSGDVLDAW